MTLIVPGILFLAIFLPGIAVGLVALLLAMTLLEIPTSFAVVVLLVPVTACYLAGAIFDRYAFGALSIARVTGFELIAPVASVLAAYLLLSSDRYLTLILSAPDRHIKLSQVLPLLNQVVLVATFVSLVLLFACLLCELPLRWLKRGSFQRLSLRLVSVRPLLLCFLLSGTLHILFDFIEDELSYAVSKHVGQSSTSLKAPTDG